MLPERHRVTEPWLFVEDHAVRARDGDTGMFTPEQLFVVVVLWDGPTDGGVGEWVGWLATVSHRSVCFCAADLEDPGFQGWLADLPGWEPSCFAHAIESPGMHLVWRRPD